jgi:hypothetical protein
MSLLPFVSLSPTLLFFAISTAPLPALFSITMVMATTLLGLPAWAREQVEQGVKAIGAGRLTPEQVAILTRLASDPRMRHDEMEAEVRNNAQIWVSAGIMPEHSDEEVEAKLEEAKRKFERQRRQDIQAEAIAWVIPLAFRVVVHPKYSAVIKPTDIAKDRRKLVYQARTLRQAAKKPSVRADALLQEAISLEEAAANLLTWAENHPLVVQRYRGNRVQRGIQIEIARLLSKLFEISPGRTAATLAAVALGVDHLSERPGRSALRPSKQTR